MSRTICVSQSVSLVTVGAVGRRPPRVGTGRGRAGFLSDLRCQDDINEEGIDTIAARRVGRSIGAAGGEWVRIAWRRMSTGAGVWEAACGRRAGAQDREERGERRSEEKNDDEGEDEDDCREDRVWHVWIGRREKERRSQEPWNAMDHGEAERRGGGSPPWVPRGG